MNWKWAGEMRQKSKTEPKLQVKSSKEAQISTLKKEITELLEYILASFLIIEKIKDPLLSSEKEMKERAIAKLAFFRGDDCYLAMENRETLQEKRDQLIEQIRINFMESELLRAGLANAEENDATKAVIEKAKHKFDDFLLSTSYGSTDDRLDCVLHRIGFFSRPQVDALSDSELRRIQGIINDLNLGM